VVRYLFKSLIWFGDMIIGLTGRIAAGKGVFADYLIDLGFKQISLSQEVREEAIRKNLEITRESLQNLGNELRNKFGAGIWAKKVVDRINNDNYPNWVVEGIRNPAEIEELKKLKNFFLVSIDAGQELRFQRVLLRAKSSDPKTWQEFLKADERDFGEQDESGQQVNKCMQLAQYHIDNSKGLQEASLEVERIFKEIKSKVID